MSAEKQKKSKKAEITLDQLGIIIIVVIIGIIIYAVVINIYNDSSEYNDKETCRLSVIARSYDPTRWSGSDSGVNFKCSTNELELGNKLLKNGKNIKYTEDPKRIIADEMSDCWYEFNQGKSNPFGDFFNNNRCFVCARITFKEKMQNKQINEFKNYVEKTPQNTQGAKENTYSKYMYNIDNAILTPDIIDTNKHYSILWMSVGSSSTDDAIKAFVSSTTQENVNYEELKPLLQEYLGNNKAVSHRYTFTTIVPTEQVSKFCQEIY